MQQKWCFVHMHRMCITCVSHVHVLHVYHVCIACVLHVYSVCIACVLHVYRVCIACVLHVYHSQPCVSVLLTSINSCPKLELSSHVDCGGIMFCCPCVLLAAISVCIVDSVCMLQLELSGCIEMVLQ